MKANPQTAHLVLANQKLTQKKPKELFLLSKTK